MPNIFMMSWKVTNRAKPISRMINGTKIRSITFLSTLLLKSISKRLRTICPPSRTGKGNKFMTPRFKLIVESQKTPSLKLSDHPFCIAPTIPIGPLRYLGLSSPWVKCPKSLEISPTPAWNWAIGFGFTFTCRSTKEIPSL